ncbi:MAG TPA: hypothetical protein VM755_02050 [Stellaceae bacterium]|nr:hypothetical protein [Stellaceae bacterium]
MIGRTRSFALLGLLLLMLLVVHPRSAAADFHQNIVELQQEFSDFVDSLFARATGSAQKAVTPPTPVALFHAMEKKRGVDFWKDLADAGYQLASIDTAVALIPDVKLTFQLVRELSDADRRYVERELEVQAMRKRGVIPAMQRQIIRTLLAVGETGNMRVGKLVIGVLPLPSAEFAVEPNNIPLSEEHDALMRAIENSRAKADATSGHEHGTPAKPSD